MIRSTRECQKSKFRLSSVHRRQQARRTRLSTNGLLGAILRETSTSISHSRTTNWIVRTLTWERNSSSGPEIPKEHTSSVQLVFQHLAHFFCALSKLLLKSANQLVFLAFSVGEVVVGQLSALLLELAFDFIPGAFELEFVHINCSGLRGGVGCIRSEPFNSESKILRHKERPTIQGSYIKMGSGT
jgi:hypothetical protein